MLAICDLAVPLEGSATFKTDYPDFSCAMITAMAIDSYWRTRTISEAQSQGYSHLRAVCSGCGRITDIPWLLLLRRPVISWDTFIGNLPLRANTAATRNRSLA